MPLSTRERFLKLEQFLLEQYTGNNVLQTWKRSNKLGIAINNLTTFGIRILFETIASIDSETIYELCFPSGVEYQIKDIVLCPKYKKDGFKFISSSWWLFYL